MFMMRKDNGDELDDDSNQRLFDSCPHQKVKRTLKVFDLYFVICLLTLISSLSLSLFVSFNPHPHSPHTHTPTPAFFVHSPCHPTDPVGHFSPFHLITFRISASQYVFIFILLICSLCLCVNMLLGLLGICFLSHKLHSTSRQNIRKE